MGGRSWSQECGSSGPDASSVLDNLYFENFQRDFDKTGRITHFLTNQVAIIFGKVKFKVKGSTSPPSPQKNKCFRQRLMSAKEVASVKEKDGTQREKFLLS